MTRSVRFIHAADVHLGAAISGLRDVSPEWSALLMGAVAKAWERVVSAAISHEVDFVVLAGDLFDTARPSYGDFLRLFQGFERLDEAGIPAYVVCGNHDPFTSWEREVSRLPPAITLLGVERPQFALHYREGEPLCIVGGRSYYSQAWPESEGIADGIGRTEALVELAKQGVDASRAAFMVGVVHTGLEPDQSKAASDLRDLLGADVDYWACGHLHERRVFPSEDVPFVVFPGCVQGRSIDEVGERGCFLVELREGAPGATGVSSAPGAPAAQASRPCAVRLEFIPTSSVIFQHVNVDVSACQTLADIRQLVQVELFRENGKAHCDEMVTKILLTGETPLHRFLSKRDVLDDLRRQINNAFPTFFCDALIDATCLPEIALTGGVGAGAGTGEEARASGAAAGSFQEIVAAMADEQRLHSETLINFVQSEFVKRGIVVPSALTQRLDEFSDEAERLVFDLLREDAQ